MALVQAHGGGYNQNTLYSLMPILQKHGIELTPPNAAGDQTKINIPGQGWVRVGFGEGHPVWIPQGEGGGGGGGGQGQAPAPYQAPQFVAPTGLTEQNDPGFQARIQQGQLGVEESAAARGGLLSGGTLKAIEDYRQNAASNEFGNVFNRALAAQGYNTGVGQQGYLNRYGQFTDAAAAAQQAANRGVTAAGQAYKPPPGA